MRFPPDYERIRRIFGAPELAPLVARLRERLARGRSLTGRITLAGLEPLQRDALERLLGRPPGMGSSRPLRVSLDELTENLRAAEICNTLREAVEALEGPITDRGQARAAREAAWQEVFAAAREQPVYSAGLAAWLDSVERSGLLKRLSAGDPATAAHLLAALGRVAARWPAHGSTLTTVAAQALGDAHALDPGTPIATLAVRAAANFGGIGYQESAEGRRAAWASVGVLCDELSTPALVLNLPAGADTPLARLLREAATAGEPLHISLRLLLRYPMAADAVLAGRDVYVCENPTITALAAARLGPACNPLVCLNGQPATPVQVLLRQLAAAGARLHVHGDFDWGGLQIARQVLERFGARPWRMGAADYLAAAHLGGRLGRVPKSSPWDPELALALARQRRAVHEELVAGTLLLDLARCGA